MPRQSKPAVPRARKTVELSDENRAESARLKELYTKANHGLSQEAFGAKFGIGNQGMVWQCLNGTGVAISLKAAKGFALGLNCQIADFSPRLAAEAAATAEFVPTEDSTRLRGDEAALLKAFRGLETAKERDIVLRAAGVIVDASPTAQQRTASQAGKYLTGKKDQASSRARKPR